MLNKLKNELNLFIKRPLSYLYLFSYPTNKTIKIAPYDERIKEIGQELLNYLKEEIPELPIHFIGSSSLEIAGQKDIDIVIECNKTDLSYYGSILSLLLQQKQEIIKPLFHEWAFKYGNYQVDLLLSDTTSSIYKVCMKTFKILNSNEKILKEYEYLKLTSNNISERAYQRKKLEFYVKLIG